MMCRRCVLVFSDEKDIRVVMVLPWRDNVFLYYVVTSSWPMSSSK